MDIGRRSLNTSCDGIVFKIARSAYSGIDPTLQAIEFEPVLVDAR